MGCLCCYGVVGYFEDKSGDVTFWGGWWMSSDARLGEKPTRSLGAQSCKYREYRPARLVHRRCGARKGVDLGIAMRGWR